MLLLFVIQKSKLCCQDIMYRVQYTMCNDFLELLFESKQTHDD